MFSPGVWAPSVLDATERRINVRIVRLEPVAERSAQHAGSGARRATLHDEVLAVEKVRGVTGIERHRGEARKRAENSACPFPPVADEVVYAESTGTSRMRTDGNGIPIRKIKVAVLCRRCIVAPRKLALKRRV